MNSVEKVRKLCKERKVPYSHLEKACGFANGYIGQLRKGSIPDDRLVKIANYFGIFVGDLMSDDAIVQVQSPVVLSYDRYAPLRKECVDVFDGLNDDNKHRFVEYGKALLSIQQMEGLTLAAHERTDTETSANDMKSDIDIMKDDKEW